MQFKRFGLILAVLALVLLAACGAPASSGSTGNGGASGGNASGSGDPIEITGDITFTMNPDTSYVEAVPLAVGEGEGLMLYINQDSTYVVFLQFPQDAKPGSYPITRDFFDNTNVTANYLDSKDKQLVFGGTEGTLTLDSVGETFSGKFEFKAEGGQTGQPNDKKINVVGTFSNVSLRKSEGS